MGSIVALFVIVVVSLVIVRIGSLALRMTGMSDDAAKFQAQSAFFGVGFTTREAEMVVNHPVRRRIAGHLIALGAIWFTGVLAAVIVAFKDIATLEQGTRTIVTIAGGLAVIWLVTRIRLVQAIGDRVFRWTLERAGVVHAVDYALLLRVHSGYYVLELDVPPDHWLVGKTLAETRLAKRGVVVLGIERADGSYEGAPSGPTRIETGDVVMAYGLEEDVRALAESSGPDP